MKSFITSIGVSLLTKVAGYGLDCSFPIHNTTLYADCGDLGDRTQAYENYMNGCRAYYSAEDCDSEEEHRLKLNRLQPQSMVVSYSSILVIACKNSMDA